VWNWRLYSRGHSVQRDNGSGADWITGSEHYSVSELPVGAILTLDPLSVSV
jgi:hypothetical protein